MQFRQSNLNWLIHEDIKIKNVSVNAKSAFLEEQKLAKQVEKKQINLANIEWTKDEDIVGASSKCDNMALIGDLQAARTTNFGIRADKFTDQITFGVEYCNVKSVAVRITHQNVTVITNVNPIWEISDCFTPNGSEKLAIVLNHCNTMGLKIK